MSKKIGCEDIDEKFGVKKLQEEFYYTNQIIHDVRKKLIRKGMKTGTDAYKYTLHVTVSFLAEAMQKYLKLNFDSKDSLELAWADFQN